ncbi:MAG TPA: DUF1385 domain-containing protein [Pyrinomonadaceae bacterium]|nr:DUF1385 domain-containing protein [Pyrinomonadaceae bacterium]
MSANEKELIVGGQAVIEGVMMRTPSAYAVAVRRADGSIKHTGARLPKWSDRYDFLRLPVLRGAAVLVQSMALGIKALNYSAAEAFADEEASEQERAVALAPAPATADGPAVPMPAPVVVPVRSERGAGDGLKRGDASAFASIAFALVFNVVLFVVAPLVLTNALFVAAGWAAPVASAPEAAPAPLSEARVAAAPDVNSADTPQATARAGAAAVTADTERAARPWYARAYEAGRAYLKPVRPSVAFNLVDGAIRMIFFLAMIFSFSLMKDIRRVFEYHGAEHKTVFTWEAGLPLTVENARRQPRQHPRCGTSFLMVVMIVAVALFSVVKFDSLAANMGVRVALIPVIAGLSYEIIRLSARREGGLVFRLMTLPGVWLQNVTTREPDDRQLEVAIVALEESLKLEPRPAQTIALA